MPTLELTVTAKLDGIPVPNFPLTIRRQVDELQQFDYEKANGGGYVAVPTGELATVQVLVLTPSQAMTVRLDGQSTAGIELAADGLLIVADATIDAGASTNVTIDNSSGSAGQVKGLAAGT